MKFSIIIPLYNKAPYINVRHLSRYSHRRIPKILCLKQYYISKKHHELAKRELMKIDFKEYKDKEYASYLWQPLWKLRTKLIKHLKEHGILAVFHYLSLHSSPYYQNKHDGRELPECDRYADCLVRLPMYYNLKDEDVIKICKLINNYASDN